MDLVIHTLIMIDAHANAFGILERRSEPPLASLRRSAGVMISVPLTSNTDVGEMNSKIEEAAAAGPREGAYT